MSVTARKNDAAIHCFGRIENKNRLPAKTQRDWEIQLQNESTKIRKSQYNPEYNRIITTEVPRYLTKEANEKNIQMWKLREQTTIRGGDNERFIDYAKKFQGTLEHLSTTAKRPKDANQDSKRFCMNRDQEKHG